MSIDAAMTTRNLENRINVTGSKEMEANSRVCEAGKPPGRANARPMMNSAVIRRYAHLSEPPRSNIAAQAPPRA